jgi:Lrp/AsnC family leucine-responsive transcriptional regulator
MKVDHLDNIDITILSELAINARASQVDLAEQVGLSSTAIARQQKVLEEQGFIRGYQAVLDLTRFGLSTTVLVRVTLESQNALKSFEAAVVDCPSVVRCFLRSARWRAISRTSNAFTEPSSLDCRGWRESNLVSPCVRS